MTVYEYETNTSHWVIIGEDVGLDGGISGAHSGLKICMSYTGDRLVIGSRYYTDTSKLHIGRTRIFQYESAQWRRMGHDLVGDDEYDYSGSSVAMTKDGSVVAIGATGDDSVQQNTGRVKVYRFNEDSQSWERRGNEIIGEAEDDESGFSVAMNDDGSRVAVGAIYNDGTDGEHHNAGHVRVYDFDEGDDGRWQQIGSDIDGVHGTTIITQEYSFHVGDALGFSISMSGKGDKLAVGAPLYSEKRIAEYYGGVTKLYEYEPISNKWEQIAYDIIDTDTDALSGYSVVLSKNGERMAIGSPGPISGEVRVYDQLEVSESPSVMPTPEASVPPSKSPSSKPSEKPTTMPSEVPSKEPSYVPSVSPTKSPSFEPSEKPTTVPSVVPSKKPSPEPSEKPTTRPSVVPSNSPSYVPSLSPSKSPSTKPSEMPTIMPTVVPSREPSSEPSIQPTTLPSVSPSSEPTLQMVSETVATYNQEFVISGLVENENNIRARMTKRDLKSFNETAFIRLFERVMGNSTSNFSDRRNGDKKITTTCKVVDLIVSPPSSVTVEYIMIWESRHENVVNYEESFLDLMETSPTSIVEEINDKIIEEGLPVTVVEIERIVIVITPMPSSAPSLSSSPSITPTFVPTFGPSLSSSPSITPTSVPTSGPSLTPSMTPSTSPSSMPSTSALPTDVPSSMPSTLADRPFSIKSSYAKLEGLIDEEGGNISSWCLESSGLGANAGLYVRPCDSSNNYQTWYFDTEGKLRLDSFTEFCMTYEGMSLGVRSCNDAKSFTFDRNNNAIAVVKQSNKTFYICVNEFKTFSRLKLLNAYIANSSWNTWHMDFMGHHDW